MVAAEPIPAINGNPMQVDVMVEGGNKNAEAIPTEVVNEAILGSPTVIVNSLRKTFGGQVAVNDLSFKMYENQIFALLGHNGAGKVRNRFYRLTGLLSFLNNLVRRPPSAC